MNHAHAIETTSPSIDARSTTPEQWVLVLLAIGQVLSPALITSLSGRDIGDGSGPEPLVTPASYAFIIWSVIVLGSLAFAIYQALPAQTHRSFYPAIRRPAIVVFAGFTLWIVAAVQNWLWLTVVLFVAMFLALQRIQSHVLSAKANWTTAERYLVALPFSLYSGWTTIAIFANLAAAIVFYGAGISGIGGLLWQVLLLVGATLNALVGIRRTGGDLPYVGTLLWALTAVVARNLIESPMPSLPTIAGFPPTQIIATLTGIACGLLVAVTVVTRRTVRSPK